MKTSTKMVGAGVLLALLLYPWPSEPEPDHEPPVEPDDTLSAGLPNLSHPIRDYFGETELAHLVEQYMLDEGWIQTTTDIEWLSRFFDDTALSYVYEWLSANSPANEERWDMLVQTYMDRYDLTSSQAQWAAAVVLESQLHGIESIRMTAFVIATAVQMVP